MQERAATPSSNRHSSLAVLCFSDSSSFRSVKPLSIFGSDDMTIGPYQRRWLFTYGFTLGALIGLAICLYMRMPTYRQPPINFYAMKPGELVNVYALTRRQAGSLKLGFAEAFPAPEVAVYGNHIIEFFGSDAFGRSDDSSYFFNYSFANLSLPEIHRYL